MKGKITKMKPNDINILLYQLKLGKSVETKLFNFFVFSRATIFGKSTTECTCQCVSG